MESVQRVAAPLAVICVLFVAQSGRAQLQTMNDVLKGPISDTWKSARSGKNAELQKQAFDYAAQALDFPDFGAFQKMVMEPLKQLDEDSQKRGLSPSEMQFKLLQNKQLEQFNQKVEEVFRETAIENYFPNQFGEKNRVLRGTRNDNLDFIVNHSTGKVQDVTTNSLLPGPSRPQSFLVNPLSGESRLGAATILQAPLLEHAKTDRNIVTRWAGNATLNGYYDTNYVGSAFDPAGIALTGSSDAQKGGQYFISESSAGGTFQLDNQVLNLFGSGLQLQGLLGFDFESENVDFNQAFGRLWDKGSTSVTVGKTYTTLGHIDIVPVSIISNRFPVGFVVGPDGSQSGDTTMLVRLDRRFAGNWGVAIAVEEDRQANDVEELPGSELLHRVPAIVGHVRYTGDNQYDTFQLGAIVRRTDFERSDRSEGHVTGWGFSALGRKALFNKRTGIMLGATGGEGLGGYVNGIKYSAVPNGTDLGTVEALGLVGGIAHNWYYDPETNLSKVWSNFGYGYSWMETMPSMDGATNRKLQQFFGNVIFSVNKHISVGFEYQYGERDVVNGNSGDNQRFQLVFLVGNEGHPQGATRYGSAGAKAIGRSTTSDASMMRL